jgi:integrase
VLFKSFDIAVNPVAETEPDESQNRADKRPLTVDELKTHWRHMQKAPGFGGALLRLHLLTGGQRIEELVQLRTSDITADAFSVLAHWPLCAFNERWAHPSGGHDMAWLGLQKRSGGH